MKTILCWLFGHPFQKTEPTERQCEVAVRIGVHPMKDLGVCSRCGLTRWIHFDGQPQRKLRRKWRYLFQ